MTASGIGDLPCGARLERKRLTLVADRQCPVRPSFLPEEGLAGQAQGYAMSRQRDVMSVVQGRIEHTIEPLAEAVRCRFACGRLLHERNTVGRTSHEKICDIELADYRDRTCRRFWQGA